MLTRAKRKPPGDKTASYWRNKYAKQSLLMKSISSLLRRYGKSLRITDLYRDFLLTLMGQYQAADACYYSLAYGSNELEPALSYGGMKQKDAEPVAMEGSVKAYFDTPRPPQHVESLPSEILQHSLFQKLADTAALCCPVYLKEKMLGIAFLGKKVSNGKYKPLDLEMLGTLCAVSAVTFNNAKLYENAKVSVSEVKKLFDLRTEMIGRISHEFRTPLTVIKAGVERAMETKDDRKILEDVGESIESLEKLIVSLLKLNRKYHDGSLEAGHMFNMSNAVYEVIAGCKDEVRQKNLTFDYTDSLIGNLPPLSISKENFQVIADALVRNAVTFSKDGSAVQISAEFVSREPEENADGRKILDWETHTRAVMDEFKKAGELPSNQQTAVDDAEDTPEMTDFRGPYVVLRVTDTGIGIPDEEIEWVGEPFRQAANAPDRGVKGRGLGLAVALRIVSDGGGWLCCKSKEEVGTTFSVFMPLA